MSHRPEVCKIKVLYTLCYSRFRDTLSVRLEDRVEDMSEDDGSEVMDGSVVSSVTDKYGFMGGESGDINSIERTKVDLEIVRRRETKWVEMMGAWDTYMMRSVSGSLVIQYTILSIPGPLGATLDN